MNRVTISIGIVAIGYGLSTIYLRRKNSKMLGKLEAMKKVWGEKAGTIIHLISYTILPVIFGISFVIAGVRGVCIF